MRKGRYYLGRISILGQITKDMVSQTFLRSPVITVGKYAWAITDPINNLDKSPPSIYGELSKFSREGFFTTVDTTSNTKIDEIAKNLLIASSPFVYLPDYSGIAYLKASSGRNSFLENFLNISLIFFSREYFLIIALSSRTRY